MMTALSELLNVSPAPFTALTLYQYIWLATTFVSVYWMVELLTLSITE
jgi:hypothetical protein